MCGPSFCLLVSSYIRSRFTNQIRSPHINMLLYSKHLRETLINENTSIWFVRHAWLWLILSFFFLGLLFTPLFIVTVHNLWADSISPSLLRGDPKSKPILCLFKP